MKELRFPGLQLFAEPREEESPSPEAREDAAFEALITGEYKAAYDRKLQRLQSQLEEARQESVRDRRALEALKLQQQYPDFSLDKALEEPHFCRLLEGGMALRTAYELCHGEELLAELHSRQAAAARPRENGMGGRSAAALMGDVSNLTRAQRREIIRRVQRGETIRF